MTRFGSISAGVLCVLSLCAVRAAAGPDLVPLARPAPWSAVSGLIGFDGRLWFTNSVKFVNHNSADLYSYDPATGTTRYERHLFSQDAGHPTIHDGLLYWPFEDSRFTIGWGEYAVTDGDRWAWRVIPHVKAYHVHAAISHDGDLYAATSAWRARLLRSSDAGLTWRVIYDHPTPDGYVSRITVLASFNGSLYAWLASRANDHPKLYRLDGGDLVPVADWPDGRRVTALAVYDGWLYALNQAPGSTAIWRTDGRAVEQIAAPPAGRVRTVYADPAGLLALTVGNGNGDLWAWQSASGWRAVQRFAGAEPVALTRFGGAVYVGTIGPDAIGTLWGPAPPTGAGPHVEIGDLRTAVQIDHDRLPDDPEATLASLLADAANYGDAGSFVGGIQPMLYRLARRRAADVGALLSRQLAVDRQAVPVHLFGGNLATSTDRVARWALIWAIALNRAGCIPTALLRAPWTAVPNKAEKYLEPVAGATWALTQTGQGDQDTIDALVERLDNADDPPWLRCDIVGALHVLSGARFGYDVRAWRDWWRRTRPLRAPAEDPCRPD